jgi:hypothetical protein
MSRVLAFTIVRLIIALMLLECVLATLVPSRPTATTRTHIEQKSFSAVLWTVFLAPEVEKVEHATDKTSSFELIDLYQNIYFLSQVHATPWQLKFFRQHYDHPASFRELFCVYII